MQPLRFDPQLRRRWLVLLGVLVAAAVGAAFAWAVIPGDDGIITACYHKSNGALRVIDPSVDRCRKTETLLSWSVSGPPGQPGSPGTGGTVYADRIMPDYPNGPPGLALPKDQFLEILTLDIPEAWRVLPNEPVTVVTTSLDVMNKSNVRVGLNCNAGNGSNFVWTIEPGVRDSVSFTAYATMTTVALHCKASQAWGPPEGVVWDVQLWRATVAASKADSISHSLPPTP